MLLHINPCVDVVFKAILGSEHHTHLLINFINAILGLKGDQRVTEVTLRNPFNQKDNLDGKGYVVDVKAYDQLNRDFQLEIQVGSHEALQERMLYNWAGLYQNKIKRGHDYAQLSPVYSIWLVVDDLPALPVHVPGFPLAREEGTSECEQVDYSERRKCDDLHICFGLYSAKPGLYLSQHLGIHVVQLKKLPPDVIIDSDKTRWVYFFGNGEDLDPDNLPEGMETPEMKEALNIVETFTENRENHHLYLSRLDEFRTRLTLQNQYERAKQQADRAQAELEQKDILLEREQAENEYLMKLLKKAGIPLKADRP